MAGQQHVVIGAGAVGSEVTRLLAAEGAQVTVVTRSGSGPQGRHVRRVRADAADLEELTRVASGATAIYNCAGPAYHRWPTDWPPLAASALGTAERTGAVLVTMSNLYGYGPCPMPMTEQTPLAATTRKGQVRARLWRDALAAHEAGRVRTAEVRASDFLGATDQSVIHSRVVPALLAGRAARLLGDPDAPHTWTCPADAARLLVLAAREPRAWGRAWHVPSHDPVTGRGLVAELCRVAGVPAVPVQPTPRWVLRVGGVFVPALRELIEVAYQHEQPFVMDSCAARTTFGLEPTPWDDVLAATLARQPARRQ